MGFQDSKIHLIPILEELLTDPGKRTSHFKGHLASILTLLSFTTTTTTPPYSYHIEPSLRQALVEQIPEFSNFFIELRNQYATGSTQDDTSGTNEPNSHLGEEAYTQILHILFPIVAELTTDRNQQVFIYFSLDIALPYRYLYIYLAYPSR